MKDVVISDLVDVSREHATAREGVLRAIQRLADTMTDAQAWRKRDKASIEHYWLRRDLPYGLHSTDKAGTRILVNRNYKPIGSNEKTGGKWAIYEEYANSHVNLTDEQIAKIAAPKTNGYLFGDGSAPWLGKREANAYLERLRKLLACL